MRKSSLETKRESDVGGDGGEEMGGDRGRNAGRIFMGGVVAKFDP